MKIKFTVVLLTTMAMIASLSAFKSQDKGQIYFMRSTNMEGSLIAYKVFIDDQVVCHLKNQHYSVHDLAPGEHTVSIQGGGLNLGGSAISRPMKIKVEAGKSNYMVVINGKQLYMQEAVESSAQELLKKLVATEKCLPN